MRNAALVLALLGLTSSCASLRAARGADGSPVTLEVYFDRNAQLQNTSQVAQVVGFMDPDLRSILLEAGYVVQQSNNPESFVPGPNRYLLLVKVLNYNPGSKAARMFVGSLGGGALVLDTQHVLFSGPGQMVVQGTSSVGSGRDWEYAARKINLQVFREVTEALWARATPGPGAR